MTEPSSKATPTVKIIPNKTRIRDSDGFVGTILYHGPVASAKNSKQLYIGVQWDDATRGKHDGSVLCLKTNTIVRHFTSTTPTGGSFLRYSKLGSSWDYGVELSMKLMKSRYVDLDAELVAPGNVLPYSARTSSGRAKPIEFLGEEVVRKRQQLKDLEDVTVRNMGVNGIQSSSNNSSDNGDDDDEANELAREFGHVKELDLAGNLLSDWDTVMDILHMFPLLHFVSFASNRIQDIVSTPMTTFPNLRKLNINKCSIKSFDTIVKLGELCPNMEELCVAHADLSDVHTVLSSYNSKNDKESSTTTTNSSSPKLSNFTKLKLLDCSSCNLSNWKEQINVFSSLPNLETLLLDDNPIESVNITPPPPSSSSSSDTKQSQEFSSLTLLQIANTQIHTSWSNMESIAHLPTLKSLRFRNTPLTSTIGTGEARSNTIARIPQITILNASAIQTRERMEAERRYVVQVSRELLLIQTELKMKREEGGGGEQKVKGSDGGGVDESNTKTTITSMEEIKTQEIYVKYPRFQELIKTHKDAMILASHQGGGAGADTTNNGSISTNAITVTIKSMAVESCTSAPLKKRLPGNLKVGRLKLMCCRAFGLSVELQRLHFRVQGDPFPTELDDDENMLTYYGVCEGAEILMNEIDVEAEEREQRNRDEVQSRRIVEQEQSSAVLQAAQKSDIQAHVTAAVEKASGGGTTS